MAKNLHLGLQGRSVPMMKRSWIWILLLLAIFASACQGEDVASPIEEDVVVATFTSTPFMDMADLAARTHTATLSPTATSTLLVAPSTTATPFEDAEEAATETAVAGPQSIVTSTETAAALAQTELSTTPEATTTETLISPTPTNSTPDESEPPLVSAEIPEGSRYFTIQEGAPIGMPNWANQDLGCAWLGLAGQVFDLEGNPELGLIVEVGGTLEGLPLLGLSITGMASVYGPGGYEIQLADHVVASQGEAWVQIKNDSGETLSGRIFLETIDDCAQNLLLLNFIEVEEIPDPNQVFVPLIIHQGNE